MISTADGVLLEGQQLPEVVGRHYLDLGSDYVRELLRQTFVDSPDGDLLDRGNLFGWIVFGTPDRPTPAGDAVRRGLELVHQHQRSHVRIVFDLVDDAWLDGRLRLKGLPWELTRWHELGRRSGLWIGASPMFTVVRQRRRAQYRAPGVARLTSLDVMHISSLYRDGAASSVERGFRDAFDVLSRVHAGIRFRIVTTGNLGTPAGVPMHDGRTDVVHYLGHGGVNSHGFVVWYGPPGRSGESGSMVARRVTATNLLDRAVDATGCVPTLLVLLTCSGSGGMAAVSPDGDALGDTMVRAGVPAVMTFLGGVDPMLLPRFLDIFYRAWLGGRSLECAMQRLRTHLRMTAPDGASRNDHWYRPVLTVIGEEALSLIAALDRIRDDDLEALDRGPRSSFDMDAALSTIAGHDSGHYDAAWWSISAERFSRISDMNDGSLEGTMGEMTTNPYRYYCGQLPVSGQYEYVVCYATAGARSVPGYRGEGKAIGGNVCLQDDTRIATSAVAMFENEFLPIVADAKNPRLAATWAPYEPDPLNGTRNEEEESFFWLNEFRALSPVTVAIQTVATRPSLEMARQAAEAAAAAPDPDRIWQHRTEAWDAFIDALVKDAQLQGILNASAPPKTPRIAMKVDVADDDNPTLVSWNDAADYPRLWALRQGYAMLLGISLGKIEVP